jgi:hypothetical protein
MTPEEANYRVAVDPNQSCAGCQHMQPDGMCKQLQMKVEPQMVCDLFMPPGETMTPEGRMSLEQMMLGGPSGEQPL